MKVFLDTDVIINILRKRPETIEKFKSLINQKTKFFISPIVIAEIYHGAREKEYKQIEELFSFLEVINIDTQIGFIAGKYANKYSKAFNKISLEDYLIAATVKVHNLTLWTYNKKHYPMEDITIL